MSVDIKILLVEDNSLDADDFIWTMNQVAHVRTQITHSLNLEEALKQVVICTPDVVFLDLSLPDTVGEEGVEIFYKNFPHLPIIALSGDSNPKLVNKVLSLGAQDFLVKGVMPADAMARCIASSIIRKGTEQSLVKKAITAEKQSQNVSMFLSRMSHEIRTPLNAILNVSELQKDFSQNAEQKKVSQILESASKGLLNIINDILDVQKIQSGEMKVEKIPVDLRAITSDVINMLSFEAEEKGIKYICDIEKDIPLQFISDPVKIKQILVNLVNNALKFTNSGSIKISIQQSLGKLLLRVSDTGVGISEENLKTIFDSFKQADNTTTRKYGGTGLGLSISRSFAELLDGELTVDSRAGVGSTFTLTLPIVVGELVKEKPYKKVTDLKKMKILVAEDSEDNVYLLKALLKKQPIEITVTQNGKQALEAISSEGLYDLIMLDMQMPIMDGYTAAQEIRKMEEKNRWKRHNIIAFTASCLSSELDRAIKCGCDSYLSKPITREALYNALSFE